MGRDPNSMTRRARLRCPANFSSENLNRRKEAFMALQFSRKIGSYFLAALLTLCFGSVSSGQTSTILDSSSQTNMGGINSIVGTVFGPGGKPLAKRVRIKLSSITRGDRIMTTDENGNFAFRGLPAGSFTVIIDREPEFEAYQSEVDVRQFRGAPAVQQTLNINLKFKDRPEEKNEVVDAEYASVPQPAMLKFRSAADHAAKGDRLAAIEELKLAIKAYPAFTQAHNELGVQYLRLNQLESADEAFQGALKVDPNYGAALINRGIANVMMQRYGEAVPVLKKAKKIDESSAVCRYFLGQALANLGLFDDAEKELVAALTLGKEAMKEAHRTLAIIYSSKGDKLKAANELETYLSLTPAAGDAEQLRAAIKQLKENP